MRWSLWNVLYVIAAVLTVAVGSYVFYLRTPAFEWKTPTVKNSEVRAAEEFNVYFEVLSKETCPLIISRFAEYTGPNGGVVELPALRFEQKVIRASPEWRSSYFPVSFPAGTEPRKYRIFSRFLINNCNWLDRWRPRVSDSPSVEVELVP